MVNFVKAAAPVLVAAAALLVTTVAAAQDAEPANTLKDLRRHFASCLAEGSPSPGSQITIVFALRRDGTAFGKPRISYSRLDRDSDRQQRFLTETAKAIDSCLPLKLTPALGRALAGRLFSVTISSPNPGRAI